MFTPSLPPPLPLLQDNSLTALAKDYDRYCCVSTGFIRDGSELAMVAADDAGNFEVLKYAPKRYDTKKTKMLDIL